jgi:hypothetical protein
VDAPVGVIRNLETFVSIGAITHQLGRRSHRRFPALPLDLMPTGPGGGQPDDGIQPFDPNPAAPGSKTRQFLTYGVDPDGNSIPFKTLRITNNTGSTVYPIMRDPNSNTIQGSSTVGLYDPYDPANKEYRGYIGYEQGGKYYFGLEKGESISREPSPSFLEWRPHRHRDGWPIPDPEWTPESTAIRSERAPRHRQRRDQWRHYPERRRDVVSSRDRPGSQ